MPADSVQYKSINYHQTISHREQKIQLLNVTREDNQDTKGVKVSSRLLYRYLCYVAYEI